MNIYNFSAKAQDGSMVSLAQYRGKVLLIVNTATGCGFTPQYEELENIYADFKDRGMEILDFPCNQFGNQAPGTDEEIQSFCTMKYHTTFPRFAKADVNGADALPLFQWLSNNTKFEGFDKNPMGLLLGQMLKKQDPEFKTSNAIKWNFTKFLIDREGNIAARFEPMTSLKKVKEKIQTLL